MRYAVLAHQDPSMLRRLVAALGPRAVVRVHLDARLDLRDFDETARLADFPDARYTSKRVAINWGGAKMVAAMRHAFEAHGNVATTEQVTWLSGSCYPIRPVSEFERFVSETPRPVLARGYLLNQAGSWHRDRILRRHLFDCGAINRLPHLPRRIVRRGVSALAPNPGSRVLLGTTVAGSQWVSLPAGCASQAFDTVNTASYAPIMRGFAPDEMALQTAVLSSPWAKLSPDGGPLIRRDPKISQLANFHLLTADMSGRPGDDDLRNPPGGIFFSRKFNSQLDAGILNELDERLGDN